MRNVSKRTGIENQNTHSVFNNVFSVNHVLYEVKGRNVVETDRATYDAIIRRMRLACLKRDALRICNNYFFP